MVDIANFRFTDVGQQFDRAYDRVGTMRDDIARGRAGNALRVGNYGAAAGELYGAGMLEEGARATNYGQAQQDRVSKQRDTQRDELMKFTADAAQRLADVQRSGKDVNRTLAAFDQLAPDFQRYGQSPEALTQVRSAIQRDPEGTLMALGAGAAKELNYEFRSSGDEVLIFDPRTKGLVGRYRGAKAVTLGDGVDLVEIPGSYGEAPASRAASPTAPPSGPERRASQPTAGDLGPLVAQLTGMGARVTSGPRSEADNRRVGGVADSYHLESRGGLARDFVPPAGVSMGQFEQTVKAKLPPGWEAINEGDHIHIEPAPQRGGAPAAADAVADRPPVPASGEARRADGPRVLISRPKAAKPGYRLMTADEKTRNGLPADGSYQIGPEGQISRVNEGPSEKPPTETQINNASLTYAMLGGNDRMNDLAKAGIFKPRTPTDSLFTPGKDNTVIFVGRNEDDRRFMQAAKEFLAPILRKDSGAAVTDTELANYMDIYVPKFEDSPAVLWQKAQARDVAIRRMYGAGRKAFDREYGPPAKWSVLTDPRGSPGARKAKAPPPQAVTTLRADPSPKRKQQFDAVFGSGAADRVLGGS